MYILQSTSLATSVAPAFSVNLVQTMTDKANGPEIEEISG
jgi:hypothetical protein